MKIKCDGDDCQAEDFPDNMHLVAPRVNLCKSCAHKLYDQLDKWRNKNDSLEGQREWER